MRGRSGGKGFTLIELLVVMGIILVLASLLLAGIAAARKWVAQAKTKTMIDNMGMALEAYKGEFGYYPLGGLDLNDDGDMDDAGEKFGAGELAGSPQLRAVCEQHEVENAQGVVERTVGPYYSPNKVNIKAGVVVDMYDNPFRYLQDGRRWKTDPATGKPFVGRIWERGYTLWSVGPDGEQDPENDNTDNDNNGKVDDKGELGDDNVSWNK